MITIRFMTLKLLFIVTFLASYKSLSQIGPNDKMSQTREKKKLKTLILGNSITHHGAMASIGWNGEWGMAASAREKDFVHKLMDTLQNQHSRLEWDYRYQNIAYWEKNFDFDFSKQDIIKDYLSYQPDILVIRLGENVDEEYAKKNNYELALIKLVNKFKAKHTQVIITGNFWPNTFKDQAQKSAALKGGYIFVDLSDLEADPRNKATGKFENSGVAYHPSDFGMRNIASKIYKAIIDNRLF